MRIDDKILNTVLFIGVQRETFVAYGTGFLTINHIDGEAFQTVVTARHVVDLIRQHTSDVVHIRLNGKDGEAHIIDTKLSAWLPHPNDQIDISVCSTTISKEVFLLSHISLEPKDLFTPEVIKEENFGIGSEIFMAGMFIARLGEIKNNPIVRVGTIAAMKSEKIRTSYGYHDAYLIELRSIDGLSGSPVFAFTTPIFRNNDNGRVMFRDTQEFFFMGMLLGHNTVQSHGDKIEIQQKNKTRKQNTATEVSVPLSTGIGIVLPYEEIVAAIEQESMTAIRKEAILKKRSNFKADSSAPLASGSASVENPTHLEEFNLLLNAASQKPKQAD